MTKKRVLITAVILAVLVFLFYREFQTWKSFDWALFRSKIGSTDKLRIVLAIALIFFGYTVRALRWSIFLRPTKDVPTRRLISPTFIGFTGLAILGRAGDLIRPVIIARKESLRLSSQFAVLAVERIFDMLAFALLLAGNLMFAPSLRSLDTFEQWQRAGAILMALVVAAALGFYLLWAQSERVETFVRKVLSPISAHTADRVSAKFRSFSDGLHTIQGAKSFFAVLFLSLLLWFSIAGAYIQIIHSFNDPRLHEMSISHCFLLMAASIVGSLLQVPVVGGGSQLTTIKTLVAVFHIEPELASAVGILIWLVTFMAVVPVGLVLAQREHVKLSQMTEEPVEEPAVTV